MTDAATFLQADQVAALYSCDNFMASKDHHPLQAEFSRGCTSQAQKIARCPRLDPRKLKGEPACASCGRDLALLCWFPWDLDINDNLREFSDQAIQLAKQVFSCPAKASKNEYGSSLALDVIIWRRAATRALRHMFAPPPLHPGTED
eukprot:1504407-Pyramimonas_sp.AAC.1